MVVTDRCYRGFWTQVEMVYLMHAGVVVGAVSMESVVSRSRTQRK
jgi:hypothetical protein